MRKILFISAMILFLCVSSFGMAFDNHRQGFIIGGLGGIALNTWTVFEPAEPDDVKVDHGANITLHFDLRIGGGFKGDKFMLYDWFVVDLVVGEKYDYVGNNGYGELYSYLTIIIFEGPGVSYYFKPTSPSLYIKSGIGIGMWDFISLGVGAMGGIGYEFTRHWSVECGVMGCFPMSLGFRINFLTISLSIIGIAY